MDEVYCQHCGCVTTQEYRQMVPTYEESKQREADMLGRMERGEYGFGDVLVAKVLKSKLVRGQQQKVEGFFRDLGLDLGQDIEGKAMYHCPACNTTNFV